MFTGPRARELESDNFASQPRQQEPDLIIVEGTDALQPDPVCVLLRPCSCTRDDRCSELLNSVAEILITGNKEHGVPQVRRVEVCGVIAEDAVDCANHVRSWLEPGCRKSRRQCNLAGAMLFFGWRVN